MRIELPSAARRLTPLLIVVLVTLAYLPVLGAGFLKLDDAWLIADNPLYRGGARAFFAVWLDPERAARLALGAEMLPVRDLFVWLQTRAFGVTAAPMHAVSLAVYASAVLMLRAALLRVLGAGALTELTALSFALHPIHVESVAWLAGQKDLLALALIAAALWTHARGGTRARVLVPLLVLLACFAKAVSVVAIVLLATEDLMLRRRADRALYAATALVTLGALAVHVYVGAQVHMVMEPAGGSRYTALITMGPVWLRYLWNCLVPVDLSIVYRVPSATRWSLAAASGYAFVLLSLSAALHVARRGQRLPLFAWLWFFVPLLPVSQVAAPLQNRMADRYAFLSVLAACLLVGWALAQVPGARTRVLAAAALTVGLMGLTLYRSVLFTDEVLLFSDAVNEDALDPVPTYRLGRAFVYAGREDEAMLAFRETLRRSGETRIQERAAAAEHLAVLLAKRGALDEAEAVLRKARTGFPRDPTLAGDLVKVLRANGQFAEAEAVDRDVRGAASR